MAGSKAISFEMFLGKIGFRFCVEENKNEILGPKIVKKQNLLQLIQWQKSNIGVKEGNKINILKVRGVACSGG